MRLSGFLTQTEADQPGFLGRIGEAIGNALSSIPSAWNDFFGGVARGAGIDGWLDWLIIIIGLGLFLSAIKGFRNKSIFWPLVTGTIGVALIGWTVT